MTYRTPDGELLNGNDPSEILWELKAGSRFGSSQGIGEFQDELIVRVNEFYGTAIRFTDDATLLDDLVSVGYLTEV